MFDTISLAKAPARFDQRLRAQLNAGAQPETLAAQHGVPLITIHFIAEALAQAGLLAPATVGRIEHAQ